MRRLLKSGQGVSLQRPPTDLTTKFDTTTRRLYRSGGGGLTRWRRRSRVRDTFCPRNLCCGGLLSSLASRGLNSGR